MWIKNHVGNYSTQHIVDVQTFYNTEENIGEESASEEDDQDHQDFWKDLNCLQFLETENAH